MAIVKMKKLKLMVANSQREKLLHELMLLGCVEISEPSEALQGEEFLSRAEAPELIRLRTEHATLESALAVLEKYAKEKRGLLAPMREVTREELLDESSLAACLQIAKRIVELDDQIRRSAADVSVKAMEMEALEPWVDLKLPLECTGTDSSALVLAALPASVDFGMASAVVAEASELAELYMVSADKRQNYVVLVAFREELDAVQAALRPLGYAPVSVSDYVGTAAENMEAIVKTLDEMAENKCRWEAEILELVSNRAELQLRADTLLTKIGKAETASRLMCSENVSVLEGWCPAEQEAEFLAVAEKLDCAWEISDPVEEDYPSVPVKLKNNKLTRSLNAVTEMYSLPAYNGVDANPWMAPFFIIFYGMMMADMGYGLLMIIACGLVLKFKKPRNHEFFELFLYSGISTFIWGAITGGFFGDAPLQLVKMLNPETTWTGLPALFSPLNNALEVLIGSLVMGFLQVLTGMAASMIKQIKRGEIMAALCGEGAWFAVFALAGAAAVTGAVKPCVIAMIVILVLTQGYGKEGIVGKLVGIGGSLYNNVTGYFSDILSYSRLMALMLSGAVIAQVFNTLAALTNNIVLFFVIAAAGNALNMGLNLLGCYVHDLRLQCLEFFGRFYEDGGKPFRPLSINTKNVDIVK